MGDKARIEELERKVTLLLNQVRLLSEKFNSHDHDLRYDMYEGKPSGTKKTDEQIEQFEQY